MHPKHGFTRTSITHHDDGSATVEHEHHTGKKVTHAVANLDGVHNSMEDHLRHPANEEKLEEEIHPGIHDEVAEKVEEGK
jgi:hypothetical protein